MGDGLLSRDLSVAGTAVLGNGRRLGLVRLVARDAGREGIVGHGVDLREAGRSGRIVRMTQRTERSLAGSRRPDIHGSRHVSGGGSVAYLARHAVVTPRQATLVGRRMADRALLVAGVLDSLGYDRVDRGGAIGTDLAESVRNQNGSGDHEAGAQQNESDG